MRQRFLKFGYFLVLGLSVAIFNSCGDDDEPQPNEAGITSLNASKISNIIFGEEISLAAQSEGSVYQWSCDGTPIQQNGSQIKWVAPNKVGTYTITVSNGGQSTQKEELDVVGLFYDEFLDMKNAWSKSSYSTATIVNGCALLTNSSTTAQASLGYIFPQTISLPFSFKTKVAVTAENWNDLPTGFSYSFYCDFLKPDNADKYIRNIYVGVNPISRTWRVRYGIRESNNTQYFDLDENSRGTRIIFEALEKMTTVSMSITENYLLQFFVNGEEIYQTSELTYILQDLGQEVVVLESFSYVIAPSSKLLIDNFYFTNDNTILK